MIFITESESKYEVDFDYKVVRRLLRSPESGSERVAEDWRPYDAIDLSLGNSCTIVWPDSTPRLPGSPEGSLPVTITSKVVEIIGE